MGILSDLRSRWGSGWLSLAIIVVLGVLALVLLTSGSSVWATESQSRLHQTVPTATFTSEPPQDTATPTRTKKPKPPSATPTPLPAEPTPTPIPTATPSPIPTVAITELTLTQTSSEMVEPGAELIFTLQLTNPGSEELQGVRIEDVLPDSLILLAVDVYGGEPEIATNRFTLVLDRLTPGLPVIITVQTLVASETPPGTVIDHQPKVTIAGREQHWPLWSVGLPPAELPPTGGMCLQL